jgi:hypothetical protein
MKTKIRRKTRSGLIQVLNVSFFCSITISKYLITDQNTLSVFISNFNVVDLKYNCFINLTEKWQRKIKQNSNFHQKILKKRQKNFSQK